MIGAILYTLGLWIFLLLLAWNLDKVFFGKDAK